MSWLIFIALLLQAPQDPQIPPIGIIDFYGLRSISEQQAREAIQIKEGDSPPDDLEGAKREAERRLKSLPGVVEARISLVCCDAGKAILFVGIGEKGAPSLQFRPAPNGKVRLPQDVMKAGKDVQNASMNAVLNGNSGEDQSSGHALSNDPVTRALQERFITFAARDLKLLRDALRHSADAEHRALAAQVIAYTANKQVVVNDLVEAMRDPADGARNNAMRALMVMAGSARQATKQQLRIPARPFIEMLNSIEWTDRNKSSWALVSLTYKRDPAILSELRQKATPSLIEMARWKSSGHAQASFILLGRVAGFPEDEIFAAWEKGDRAAFVEAAIKRVNAN
ncbi:MAG TPA: HEAT repeat domain-containing protein [Blastocatellia bacterium]|nr:HEAT repeat domain-containing protein [Blastocatellia bacterium]